MSNFRALTPQEIKKLTDCAFGDKCKKIDDCIFRHCPEVQPDSPQCTKWGNNYGCRRIDCKFQHTIVEIKDKNQRVFFLWDIQNCPVPKGTKAFDIVSKVRTITESRTGKAMETRFDCFCNVSQLSNDVREGLHHANIQLVDVPVSKPQAVDQKILQEFTRISMDYDGPATIVLISGDIDFLPSLLAIKGRKNFSLGLFFSASTKSEMLNSMDWKFDWNGLFPKPAKKDPQQKQAENNAKTPKEKPPKSEKVNGKDDNQKGEKSGKSEKSNENSFKCKICKQEFDTKNAVVQHKNAKHANDKTPTKEKKEPKEKKEQKEKEPKKKDDQKKMKCFACKSIFASKESLDQHRNAVKHWMCKDCSLTFESSKALHSHACAMERKKKITEAINKAQVSLQFIESSSESDSDSSN